MAVPKKKVSKARRDKRRSNVWKLDLPGMTNAPSAVNTTFLTEFARSAALTTAKKSLSRTLNRAK